MVEIRKAEDKDKPAVWQIIRTVLAGDNTYVFPSNSTEEEMTAYWFAPDKRVFVILSEGTVVGTNVGSEPGAIATGFCVADERTQSLPLPVLKFYA